jgi:hypothetical protein
VPDSGNGRFILERVARPDRHDADVLAHAEDDDRGLVETFRRTKSSRSSTGATTLA